MEADAFMVAHDLTHFVLETQLNFTEGFYGLLAKGIDITDFEKKQKINPAVIPAAGIRAEILVGLLLTEKNDGVPMHDFNAQYGEIQEKFELSKESLEEDALALLRIGIEEMMGDWKNIAVGKCLVLNFRADSTELEFPLTAGPRN